MLTNYQTLNRSLEHKGGSIKMCYIKKTVRHQGKDKLLYVGFARFAEKNATLFKYDKRTLLEPAVLVIFYVLLRV